MKKTLMRLLAAVTAMPLIASQAVSAADVFVDAKPAEPMAAEAGNTSTEPTAEALEQVIKAVKPRLDVPESCTAFSWHYNAPSYYGRATWNLAWRDNETGDEVNVRCDDSGRVSFYAFYKGGERYAYGNGPTVLPAFSRGELEEKAAGYLAKICPEATGSFVLQSDKTSTSRYTKEYDYVFARFENGVLCPDDAATVAVDYTTGELKSLSLAMHYGLDFQAPGNVSKDDAKAALQKAQHMSLSYRLKTDFDETTGKPQYKAYLVYTPDVGYLSVDASSGEVYTERDTWNIRDEAPRYAASGASNKAMAFDADGVAEETAEYELTEEELAELDVIAGLLTKDEAIACVTGNEYLYIDPEATAVSAYLSERRDYYVPYRYREAAKTSDEQKKYQWNISFEAPYMDWNEREQYGYFYPNMHATVDAETGAILSFAASLPGYRYYKNDKRDVDLPALTVDADAAADIFRAFAETQMSEKLALARLSNKGETLVIDYAKRDTLEDPVFRAVNVNYVRVNEGVDFPFNSIAGTVDRVTGKVSSFRYTWYDEVTFESPKDAVTPEKAYEAILADEGFGLVYEINSHYTYNRYLADENAGKYIDYNALYESEQYTRAVFTAYDVPTTTVSALTGKLIDYNGEEYRRPAPFGYRDVAGHWAESAINTLLDLGIGFEGEDFRPDEAITRADYRYLMNALGRYADETAGTDDKETLSRVEAVKSLIASAGYAKIAAMPDIFITDFADNSELKREDVGTIAIARGFGFIEGDMGVFRPYDKLTRAEAAVMLLRFIVTDL